MALSIFPENRNSIGITGGVKLFLDFNLTQRASLFDLNGKPLPGNVLNITGATMPEFQSSASVLYVANAAGETIAIAPHAQRTAVVVTGSKGANAALTSLMAALVQLGLVVDTTS